MDQTDGDIGQRDIRYDPLPSQRRFHDSAARFKGFSGPVGSGKSQALCHEAIRLSYVNPGRTGLVGAPTYPMLRDATLASFLEVLRTNEIPHELNKAESVVTMRETGSRILFRAIEEFERLRGTNLAWFGVDELTYAPQEAWLRLEGRLRDPKATELRGFAVWTPKGFDWVYKRFIRDRVEGYEAILAKPFENRHVLEQIPDFYERLRHSYDPLFYEQEVLGSYLNMHAGAVYSSFERDRNVSDVKLDPAAPLLWALDFNVDPMSSVVAQRNADSIHVLDEIVLSRASTEQACEEFETRFGKFIGALRIYGDASGARMQTGGTNDYRIVSQFFRSRGRRDVSFKVPRSNPAVRERVARTNAWLHSAAGGTRVLIHSRCKGLIRDLEEVTYKPESSVIDKERDAKLTHLSDALGYLIWQESDTQPGYGLRPERLF